MIMGLLILLNAQLFAVLVYAANEWRNASHYRRENLQAQEDALVYDDLIARVVTKRASVVAGGKRQRNDQRHDENVVVGRNGSDGSHEGLLS